jgi:single-strand DNA-binding protein
MSYQIVIVQGNVGRDPETRYGQNGKAVTKFSVAVSDKGGGKEHTEWFNAVCFDKTAEIAGQYVKKGSAILLEGRFKTEDYEKDGVSKRYTSLLVSRLTLLGKKGDSDGQREQAPQRQNHREESQKAQQAGGFVDDDLPFGVAGDGVW